MNIVLEEEFLEKVSSWRHHIHQHPELRYEEFDTASYVASKLEEFGCEVVCGIGGTGVMAKIQGNQPGPIVGIRADMDALPIEECNNSPYKSTYKGKMHACGHDGHTAILLGAAEKMSISRDFRGTFVLIFQPAEEGGAGALAMMKDERWDTFGIEKIYGLHNIPQIKLGSFAVIDGPCMASSNPFTYNLRGTGGHAAFPHLCPDILSAASTLVLELSGLSRRICAATEPLVITVTQIHSGTTKDSGVIPAKCMIDGTVRCFSADMRIKVEEALNILGRSIQNSFQLEVELEYKKGPPVNFNHQQQALELRNAALAAGLEELKSFPPIPGSEDFSYFSEVLPSAYLFLGVGDEAHNASVHSLHSCKYDFNDKAIKHGVKIWTSLLQSCL